MNTKTLLCILLFCLTSLCTQAQIKENKKLDKLLTKIKKQEYLFTDYKLTSKTKKTASKLFKIASETELIEISKVNCELCFVYALWVLSKKKHETGYKIYKDYIDEKYKDLEQKSYAFTEINQIKKNRGCVVVLFGVDDFLYEVYNEGKYLNEVK